MYNFNSSFILEPIQGTNLTIKSLKFELWRQSIFWPYLLTILNTYLPILVEIKSISTKVNRPH